MSDNVCNLTGRSENAVNYGDAGDYKFDFAYLRTNRLSPRWNFFLKLYFISALIYRIQRIM